jgi:hypothetical protein
MNRRDLLKWFGAGATIAPIVSGMPKLEAAASLIEVPKVKPVTLEKEMPKFLHPVEALYGRKPLDITLVVRDPETGATFSMRGQSVVVSARRMIGPCDGARRMIGPCDITTHSVESPFSERVVSFFEQQQHWEMSGIITGPPVLRYSAS